MAPAITSERSAPPASELEQLKLAEFVRLSLRDAPFVLAYLSPEPGSQVRLVTLSNASEPQRIMGAALLELEKQALAQRGGAQLL